MGNTRLISIATAAVVALNLGAVTAPSADAAQRGGGGDNCVAISGGIVENATVIDVVADGGTAISDASGGSGNLAADAGNDRDRDRNGNNNNRNNNNNNNRRNNRNNWSSETLYELEPRLLQSDADTASAGNAGVATASADGGAVSIEDINSGGNAGNAISVGDTVCPGAAHGNAGGGKAPAGGATGGRGGGKIRALPSTGVGELGAGSSSLLLALGALGMMGLSLGSRLDRRVTITAGR